MSKLLVSILSESGLISSTRLNLLLSLCMSFIIVILGIVYNRDLANIAIIVGMFLTPAAALKGYQKTQEVKSESKD